MRYTKVECDKFVIEMEAEWHLRISIDVNRVVPMKIYRYKPVEEENR